MALVVEILRVDCDDPAGHVTGFGIPADVVAQLERRRHAGASLHRCGFVSVAVRIIGAGRGWKKIQTAAQRCAGGASVMPASDAFSFS
jgi:hypothetical protein